MGDIFDDLNLNSTYEEEPTDSIIDTESYKANPQIRPVIAVNSISESEVIFDKNLKRKARVVVAPQIGKLILREHVIDKFTTKRTRRVITPSMCIKLGCSFDIAVANGFDSWNDVPDSKREVLLEALEKHGSVFHSVANEHIIDSDDMPTKWLRTKTSA